MRTKILFITIITLGSIITAQTSANLNSLKIVGKGEHNTQEIIAREIKDVNGDVCAGLQILTDLEGLTFNANNKIVKVVSNPGIDLLYLSPGEQVVTVYKTGFEPLRIMLHDAGVRLKSGEVWQIKITGTKTGTSARADENLFDVVFKLDQDAVYSWYGELAPVLSRDRIITYKLPKGNYTFHFQKEGYKPEEKVLSIDKPASETISLSSGSSAIGSQLKLPGIVVITSEPSSSEIILNGQKIGTTSYQGELQPGNYEIELRKTFYHSDISSFTIEQGKTITINRTLKPKFGYISVNSSVAGSKVTLDDKIIGNAPVEKYQVESSAHIVKVESDLYHVYTEEFLIRDGDQKTITASLKPAFGSVEISSMPESGADVFIDGNKAGRTPYSRDRIASGKYLLRVTKDLFRDYEEQIVVSDGEKLTKNIALDKNFGEFTVNADQCEIFLNGKSIGRNSVTQKLTAGKYSLSAARGAKYYKAEQELYLSIGDKKEITLTPQPMMGGLSLFVEPTEASDAEIYINNELKGKAPLVIPLLIGDYTVTSKKSNYLDVTQQFTLAENEQKKITLSMLTYEGSRLQTANKWGTVKWISFSGAAILGGASYYFNTVADKNFSSYQSAAATADALHYRQLTDDNKKMRDYFMYGATVALSSALISWLIQVLQ